MNSLYIAFFFRNVDEITSSSRRTDLGPSGTEIIPVEVKAGKTGRLKSLHQFVKEKGVDLSVRINLAKPSVFQESIRVPGGQSVEFNLLSIPFYLVGQVRRLAQEETVQIPLQQQ